MNQKKCPCSALCRLQMQINFMQAQINGLPSGGGTTTIEVGTVEVVPEGDQYFTITGNPESGYVINVGFPQSSGSSSYKGEYETSAELITNNPDSVLADYGYVNETSSFWYYSPTLGTYVNQNVSATEYMAYSEEVRSEIPFIIIPG